MKVVNAFVPVALLAQYLTTASAQLFLTNNTLMEKANKINAPTKINSPSKINFTTKSKPVKMKGAKMENAMKVDKSSTNLFLSNNTLMEKAQKNNSPSKIKFTTKSKPVKMKGAKMEKAIKVDKSSTNLFLSNNTLMEKAQKNSSPSKIKFTTKSKPVKTKGAKMEKAMKGNAFKNIKTDPFKTKGAKIEKAKKVNDPKKSKALKNKGAKKPAKKGKSLTCPPVSAYVPPANCAAPVCYADMDKLINDINTNLNTEGSTFTATLCPGTHNWPGDKAVQVSVKATLELFCCGSAQTCIIDGGAPVVRTSRLFALKGHINLNIQGITFRNIACPSDGTNTNCDGALLRINGPGTITIKHNSFSQVEGGYVSICSYRKYSMYA